MSSFRLRSGALVACALLAAGVVGSTAVADDTTSPTLTVAFTPQTAAPGSTVTITATVTPGTGPESTGLAVTCNLSWANLGGSASLDPDATGLVFSRTFTVPSTAVPGGRIGTCTVTDDQSRSGSTGYSFTLSESTPPNLPPTVDANGPYSVAEGGSVVLGAIGSDPEDAALTYEWDLDNNGTYETTGSAATFSAGGLDGPSWHTVGVRVTDAGGLTATDTATVYIRNTPPTATLSTPSTAFAGFPVTLSLTSPQDPSDADTAEGFTYAFDCGGGYGAFGASSTASCPTTDVGTLMVAAKIQDKDLGVTEYHVKVSVIVTFDSLCDLVRSYSTDPKVADDLCAKLATAEAASTQNAHDGALGAFRNQADAKVGKGLTQNQADELDGLSRRL